MQEVDDDPVAGSDPPQPQKPVQQPAEGTGPVFSGPASSEPVVVQADAAMEQSVGDDDLPSFSDDGELEVQVIPVQQSMEQAVAPGAQGVQQQVDPLPPVLEAGGVPVDEASSVPEQLQ